MNKRRSTPQKENTNEDDSTAVRNFLVKRLDKQNGLGVNWHFIGQILFKSAFDVLNMLPDDKRAALARRVHERSYEFMVGGVAGDGDGPDPFPAASALSSAPSSRPELKAPKPSPPSV